MPTASQKGFILPFSLLLATTLLVLATLLLSQGELSLENKHQEAVRTRVRQTLRLNGPAMVESLASQLLQGSATSALLLWNTETSPPVAQPVAFRKGQKKPIHLSSQNGLDGQADLAFQSPVSSTAFQADWMDASPEKADRQIKLAWAAEDIALNPPENPPPPAWPLPAWNLVPAGDEVLIDQWMAGHTTGKWDAGPWVPIDSELPFTPEASPGLVPVMTWAALRFGIFASGAVTGREKVIRVRYYLEGAIWNPYNRSMRMHAGTGEKASFQIAFWNLPQVRIVNLTRGISTSWLSMDDAVNNGTGSVGIEGWIRTKAVLAPGEECRFQEPDPRWQEEGLARTLHPAFMVGPADHVLLEFRPHADGLYLAFLPMIDGDALTAAKSGDGWFRMEGFSLDLSDMEFTRADEGPSPFFLQQGSLSFRQENAQLQVFVQGPAATASSTVDPRRKSAKQGTLFQTPEGDELPMETVFSAELHSLRKAPPGLPKPIRRIPLFSWPEHYPESLIEATDLPQWDGAFRLGSADAVRVNALFDDPLPLSASQEGEAFEVALENGEIRKFVPANHINQVSENAWESVFSRRTKTLPNGLYAFSAYPTVNTQRTEDFRYRSIEEIQQAARSLVPKIRQRPSRSVSDFFNRGLLEKAFPDSLADDSLHALMPLRGWLGSRPSMRGKGAAWILHLAVEAKEADSTFRQSARFWLMENTSSDETPSFEIIHFEWTDPLTHCLPFPN